MTISKPAARRGLLTCLAAVAALFADLRARRGRKVGRALALAVSIPLVVGGVASGLAWPAHAAPPTRVVDRTADVTCTAVSQGIEITVRASRSDLVGTESSVQISDPTGETIGGGGSSSDWGDGTVRAAIPVLDNDDRPTGEEVYFAAAYTATGQPQLIRDRFNVGNVHVVEEHSETSLRVSEVTLTYAGITFDPTCDGSLVDGSLFFTNPATRVEFGSFLPYDCTGSNVAEGEWTVAGTLDELLVDVIYEDRPAASASGRVMPDGGTWQGEFRLQISDEPAGSMAATATLEQSGHPYHATDGDTGMRDHFHVTPYRFTLVVDGPGAPAALDCTLYDVRQKRHERNLTN